MAGGYDGSIRINTLLNAIPLTNGINSIESKLKSLAGAIGLAFGTKELIEFGKNAIESASDLAEAQNVVDTAFGSMSYKMEQFAATALETYGISELTAKNMGSTYMAMAKGMGVATDAASDMAVTLTGRLADVMSFYNKTQSEVDTIGRAMITGETEPLKAIGVVMTQTNLSAYALAQGFAKAYDEMSSSEQLLVRYKYLMEQTSLAQGDFTKTIDGWANQTRLLSENFNAFMTNIGNVLMNVFTPAVQFANEAVTFLNDLFFGNDAEDTTAAKNAEAVTDEVTSVGTEADKSKKKLDNLLSGFDELHVISGGDKKTDDTAAIDDSLFVQNSLENSLDTVTTIGGKYREVLEEIYFTVKNHPFTQAVINAFKKISGILSGVSGKNFTVSSFVDGVLDIVGAITTFAAIKGSVKIVTGLITGIKTTFTTMGTALGIGASGFALATGLAVGFGVIMGSIMLLVKNLRDDQIADKFGNIRLSMQQIDDLCDPVSASYEKLAKKFETHSDTVDSLKSEFEDLSTALQTTFDKYQKLGKVSIDDLPDFSEQINTSIDKVDELVDEQTSGAVSLLSQYFSLDGIDSDEQAALDDISGFGTNLDTKIETIRGQIQSITQTAIDENRDLLESELQNIRDLYSEIEKYGNIQTSAANTAAWDLLETDMGRLQIDKTSYDMLIQRIDEVQQSALDAIDTQRSEAYKTINEAAELKRIDGVSGAEIEAFKKAQYALIDKTYDDSRVDAVAEANVLRKKVASGLIDSLGGDGSIIGDNNKWYDSVVSTFTGEYGDVAVENMMKQLFNKIKTAENQIIDTSADGTHAQERFDSYSSRVEAAEIAKQISEDFGYIIGTSATEALGGTYVPFTERIAKTGGENIINGIQGAVNNSNVDYMPLFSGLSTSADGYLDDVEKKISSAPFVQGYSGTVTNPYTMLSAGIPAISGSSSPNIELNFYNSTGQKTETVNVNTSTATRSDFWLTNGKTR